MHSNARFSYIKTYFNQHNNVMTHNTTLKLIEQRFGKRESAYIFPHFDDFNLEKDFCRQVEAKVVGTPVLILHDTYFQKISLISLFAEESMGYLHPASSMCYYYYQGNMKKHDNEIVYLYLDKRF